MHVIKIHENACELCDDVYYSKESFNKHNKDKAKDGREIMKRQQHQHKQQTYGGGQATA